MMKQLDTALRESDITDEQRKVQREILTEYLRLLRSEMHLRIDKNYTLVSLKLTSLAAIASFSIANFGKVRGFDWVAYLAAPLIAIMFDLHIAVNLKWMNTTGTFIRDKVEAFFEKEYQITLYETQALGFNAYLMRLADSIATALVVALCAIAFLEAAPFPEGWKNGAVIALVVLYATSTLLLLDSIRGHVFRGIDTIART